MLTAGNVTQLDISVTSGSVTFSGAVCTIRHQPLGLGRYTVLSDTVVEYAHRWHLIMQAGVVLDKEGNSYAGLGPMEYHFDVSPTAAPTAAPTTLEVGSHEMARAQLR